MQFEETYVEDRDVTCQECDFDNSVEISLVSYGSVEVGEWECPSCHAMHDYSEDTIWNRIDEYNDMVRGK